MSSLHIIRGLPCRSLLARAPLPHILRRYKFSGRTQAPPKEKPLLPDTPARTRFAPSPTGYVHIGSLRTALYNYLLAAATGGQFIIRIEDTDQARIVQDAEKRLYEDLKWSGLSWDEGPDVGGPYGPYRQSERLELYNKYAAQLLNQGHAYRCFCNPKDLDLMRSTSIQEGTPTRYNGTCSHIPPDVSARRAANGEPHCVRFKGGDRPLVIDLVYGHYMQPQPEDDFIIIKRDGYPTYHFANVVDDHLMEITHVIRGAEWLVSTPRHVALYDALGWQKPLFAHVGLLVNQDGQKLSKRHGDADISSWRDRGILPATLLNYVMLLGCRTSKNPEGREVMDLKQMVSKFHLGFTTGSIMVNDKYKFLQQAHVKMLAKPKSLGLAGAFKFVLPAIQAHAQKYEAQRKSGSTSVDSPVAELGPLVPRARPEPGEGSENELVSKSYIEKVLEYDILNYKDAEDYVWRHRYVIWQVPESLYRPSFEELVARVVEIHVVKVEESTGDDETAPPVMKREELLISDFVARLRDLLQGIDPRLWTTDGLTLGISSFIKSVYGTPDKFTKKGVRPEPELWGYHLLRWVFAGSQPGPGLIPSMAVVGKKETMRRIEKAYEVAKSIESESET
ncbi:hypothetical protein F5Y06DRAFT_262907 [Hypoxylon sp. FL0890]|nr:hypothetical protein F5Y06DRAFT_262907 [Hypoxylon sp. FL0890]